MIESTTKVQRNERVVFRNLPDGAVLLHLDTAAYHGVNEVGAAIWELLDPAPAFGDLVAALRAKLDDPPDDLDQETGEYLDDLAARGLVELIPADPAPAGSAG
jgi:hypothetical protein